VANEVLIKIQAELGDLASELRKVRGLVQETTDATKTGFGGLQSQFDGLTAAYIKFTAAWEATKRIAQTVQVAFAPSVAFEAAMKRVNTLVDLSEAQFNDLANQVEALSKRVPQTATQLADGLYQAISSGVTDTGDALKVLEVSAKAAVGGVTDAFTAVDVITTILNSYGLAADQAGYVSDLLFQTVKDGKTTFNELAPVLGRVTPIAANLGVSLEELSAAIATLTIGGIRSEQAVTGILSFLRSLSTVSEDGKRYAQSLGLQWDTTIVKTRGLVGAIEALREATGGNAEAIKALVNDSEGWIAALALTGEGYGVLKDEVEKMSAAAGQADRAFGIMSTSAQNQLSSIGNSLSQLSRDLFDKLLPVLTNLATAMRSLADNFNTLYQAAKPALSLLTVFAVSSVIAAIPALFAGLAAKVTLLQASFWGLAGAEAAATGGLSAIAAAAGVSAIGALAYSFSQTASGATDTSSALNGVASAAQAAAAGVKGYGEAAKGAVPGIGILKDTTQSFQDLLDDLKKKQDDEKAAREAAEKQAAENQRILWAAELADLKLTLKNRLAVKEAWAKAEKAIEDRRNEERKQELESQANIIESQIAEDQARWQRQVDALEGFFGAFARSMGDAFEGAFTDGLSGLRDGLKQVLLTVMAAIEQLVLGAKIEALAQAIVMAKFNPALSLAAISSKLPAIIGLEALFAGLRAGIMKFEHGGVIDRPTLALMGEAVHRSGPEAVIPKRGAKEAVKEWMSEAAGAITGGLGDEDRAILREIRDALHPARFGRAAGRQMGREFALATRGRL